MPGPASATFPFEALAEGIATLGADGTLQPCNAAMRALLAVWSPSPDERARLAGGAPVTVHAEDRTCVVRCAAAHGTTWVVAQAPDSDTVPAALAAARVRALGELAGSLAHELNNLFGAAMGTAAMLEANAADAADRRLAGELQRGAARGAVVARTLVRLLVATPRQRRDIAAAELVEGAVALCARAAAQKGVELRVAVAADLPPVRCLVDEASQALVQGLLGLLAQGARRLAVEVAACVAAAGGGRARPCVRVRIAAEAVAPATATPGLDGWRDLAALVLRRAGGDLVVAATPTGCQVDYLWPVAGRA
ncbi:MAG: hypothetical protein KF830_16150 [Planctomycetes bacterium]|nr:hypothetical protein [Planctomycetota bacterium]